MLTHLEENPSVYTQLENTGNELVSGFKAINQQLGLNYTFNRIGSMFTMFFTDQHVTDFASAKTSDLPLFGRYFNAMLNRGVYMAPSQFESLFLSTALEAQHIRHILTAHEEALKEMMA
jgi:glutamate-1-semialdehyde 2,1-aminomutase